MSDEPYEVGYRDGESNVQSDWEFALSEFTDMPDEACESPRKAAEYVAALEALVRRAHAAGYLDTAAS